MQCTIIIIYLKGVGFAKVIAYTPYTLRFISYFLDDAIHDGEDFG